MADAAVARIAQSPRSRARSAVLLVAAFVVLSLLWNLPVRPSGFVWSWLAAPALEIAAVFALLALVAPLRTGRAGQIAALAVALATTLVVALKAADLVIYESLGRPLNPVLDVHLARSLVDLLTETLGGLLGWLALAALALLPLLVFAVSFAAVRGAQRALASPFARHATAAVVRHAHRPVRRTAVAAPGVRAAPAGVEPRQRHAARPVACGRERRSPAWPRSKPRSRRTRSAPCPETACSRA